MLVAVVAGILSFVIALLVTPVLRDYFLRLGLVDKPDSVRKFHQKPIPRLGGIAIVLAYASSLGLVALFPHPDWQFLANRSSVVGAFFGGALVVFLAGLIDDLMNIRPWQKLTAQVAAATLIFFAGAKFVVARGTAWEEPLSFLVTVIWLVGCTNAFNLIDGLDGLASGVGLFATVTMLIAAVVHRQSDLVIAALPLAGALLGFLRYNFNPASIFLGDCGSMLIGFLLGCFAIEWSHKSTTLLGLTAPMMALAVPLLDVFLSVARRFLRNRPVFGADRGHIHHKLLDLGFTPRQAALVAYGISFMAAVFSLLQNSLHRDYGAAIVIIFCLVVWIGIQNLRYVEFSMASRLLLKGGLVQMIDFESKLKQCENDMREADTLEKLAEIVRRSSRDFGFHGSRLALFGKVYLDIDDGYQDSMQLRIPLIQGNYVNFYGVEGRLQSLNLNSFLPVLSNTLNEKISQLSVVRPMRAESEGKRPKLVKTA